MDHKKLSLNREQKEFDYRLDNSLYRMLPRDQRLKSFGLLLMYLFWYSIAILFIMNRVGGNDLDEMEKEAHERLKKIEQAKNI